MDLHEYGILGCKRFSEITSGVGAIGSIKGFPGGSCSHDAAPLFTPARPEINDILRPLDDLHVVFDDGNRVALLHEFLKLCTLVGFNVMASCKILICQKVKIYLSNLELIDFKCY